MNADEITLCDLALREGLVLDYIHRHRSEIARVDRYPDVRRRSTIELAERCNWEAEHSKQVTRLALDLFDQTKTLHGLGDKEREWLEYASVLHDIGNHISYERHHQHSYYLIKNGDLRGFEPDEIEVIALLTRYHRRAMPKRSHQGYGKLTKRLRRTIKTLSVFLRLAETLDRSRNGIVRKVEVQQRNGKLRLDVYATSDSELEIWAASKQLDALETTLGNPAEIVAHEISDPDDTGRSSRPRSTGRRRAAQEVTTTAQASIH